MNFQITSMKILLLDTSSAYCSVAVINDERVAHDIHYIPRQHNQFLIDIADRTLQQSGLIIDDIDILAYGVGPGSFVGVRLASAFMHGLSMAKNIPLLGFSSMEVIAYHQHLMHHKNVISVLLDAKMGDVYYGQYDFSCQNTLSSEILISYQQLADLAPSGWVVSDMAIDKNSAEICPDLNVYSKLFSQRIQTNPAMLQESSAQPIYLQGTKNWKKKGE